MLSFCSSLGTNVIIVAYFVHANTYFPEVFHQCMNETNVHTRYTYPKLLDISRVAGSVSWEEQQNAQVECSNISLQDETTRLKSHKTATLFLKMNQALLRPIAVSNINLHFYLQSITLKRVANVGSFSVTHPALLPRRQNVILGQFQPSPILTLHFPWNHHDVITLSTLSSRQDSLNKISPANIMMLSSYCSILAATWRANPNL